MKGRGIVPLTGRSGLLGDQRNNNFLDVAFGKGDMVTTFHTVFFLPTSYFLIHAGQHNFCDHQIGSSLSVEFRETSRKVGGIKSQGVSRIILVRFFSSASLGYVTSLPRPDLASVPDVTAMSYDETHSSLTVVYSDHSLVTWDVVTNVSMISSHNFHSSCVWSVDTFQGRNNLDLRKSM